MLDLFDDEAIWPFVTMFLFLLYSGFMFLWVRGHVKRIDGKFAALGLWAIDVTALLDRLAKKEPPKKEPSTPDMQHFIKLVKEEQDSPTNLD